MNTFIRKEAHGLSKTDPARAIKQGLDTLSAADAKILVEKSCVDVISWL